MAAYYPRRTVTIKDLQKVFWKKFELETWDDDEEDRLDALAVYVFFLSFFSISGPTYPWGVIFSI